MSFFGRRLRGHGLSYYRDQAKEVIEIRQRQIEGCQKQIDNIHRQSLRYGGRLTENQQKRLNELQSEINFHKDKIDKTHYFISNTSKYVSKNPQYDYNVKNITTQ